MLLGHCLSHCLGQSDLERILRRLAEVPAACRFGWNGGLSKGYGHPCGRPIVCPTVFECRNSEVYTADEVCSAMMLIVHVTMDCDSTHAAWRMPS